MARRRTRPRRWKRSSSTPRCCAAGPRCLKPIDFSEDDIAVDAIKGIAPGGHFFGAAHTLARYESAFYRPILSDWSNFENWTEAGSRNATERATDIWKKMLAEYEPPPLDPAIQEAVAAYVMRRTSELGRSG